MGQNHQSRPEHEGGDEWSGLRNDVGEIADAALLQGRHFVDSAKGQVTDYADRRKADAAQSVAALAATLRGSTASFDDRPNIQAVVDSAAEGLDNLAHTIRDRTFTEMFGDVEDVVRRRPATFGVAALALGFLAARFIKSTSDDLRDSQEQERVDGLTARRAEPTRRVT